MRLSIDQYEQGFNDAYQMALDTIEKHSKVGKKSRFYGLLVRSRTTSSLRKEVQQKPTAKRSIITKFLNLFNRYA
ncbi:MAG: hypothetical protein CMP22_07670 [Rickettsiales bacterium]|nr:hypothetical protein [Rickettsiales bacterium]|tara:strand:- start:990 stop:1214 length:225 start_codon:yes stop_codon:yes gene_type:complete